MGVAALVNWNDIVKVNDAVALEEWPADAVGQREELDCAGKRRASGSAAYRRYRPLPSQVACSFTALITATASFQLTSAATTPGATTATPTATEGHGVLGRFDRSF
jgi:hypothetical protein